MKPCISLAALGLFAAACSGEPAPFDGGLDAGSTDGACPLATDAGTSFDTGTMGAVQGPFAGEAYCPCGSPLTCAPGSVRTCGTCLALPAAPQTVNGVVQGTLRRIGCSEQVQGVACDPAMPPAPPDLACVLDADPLALPAPSPAGPRVTVFGSVAPYLAGNDANDTGQVRVRIFSLENGFGTLVGEDTATIASPAAQTSGALTLGGYHIANVPTERPLLIETFGTSIGYTHHTYDYSVVLHARDINAHAPPAGLNLTGNTVYLQARAFADATWSALPGTVAPGGVRTGRALVIGEVHDCDDVRLANAAVASDPFVSLGVGAYFGDLDTAPRPLTASSNGGTQTAGLFMLVDLDATVTGTNTATGAPVRVVAAGYDPSGRVVHVGSTTARLFPDALTLVTVRGLPIR